MIESGFPIPTGYGGGERDSPATTDLLVLRLAEPRGAVRPGPQRMTRRPARRPAQRATEREVGVVTAVLVAGSEKAAAHRLGLSHSTASASAAGSPADSKPWGTRSPSPGSFPLPNPGIFSRHFGQSRGS
jgi:hypothetical protein